MRRRGKKRTPKKSEGCEDSMSAVRGVVKNGEKKERDLESARNWTPLSQKKKLSRLMFVLMLQSARLEEEAKMVEGNNPQELRSPTRC